MHCNFAGRGGVDDTRLETKAKDTKKNPRPRTDPLRAKDRNALGQCQGPRTQRGGNLKKKGLRSKTSEISSVLQEKMSLKFFSQALWRSSRRNKIGHDLGPFSASQKIVLSSSRRQGIFKDLQASKPRPRTSNRVLEDSTSVRLYWLKRWFIAVNFVAAIFHTDLISFKALMRT